MSQIITEVTAFNAERMLEIEQTTVVSGEVKPDGTLTLKTRAGVELDAGEVIGPQGDRGVQGIPGITTVPHGDNGAAARPVSAIVHWVGKAFPQNSIATDFWTKLNVT